MNGWLRLAWSHARHHRARTLLAAACVGVTLFLPLGSELLLRRYRTELLARAEATPLVAGPRGARFDLVLSALYLREARGTSQAGEITRGDGLELARSGLCTAVPLRLGFQARGLPVVGTTPEYFEQRRLELTAGTLPLELGDVVLGHAAARDLSLGIGDRLHSEPEQVYDLAQAGAQELRVTGVLRSSGTADDGVIFSSLGTSLLLAGLAHGHDSEVEEKLVLSETESSMLLSEALIEHQEYDATKAADYHFHGDPAAHALSAVLVFPHDAKSKTLLKARLNAGTRLQMLEPPLVVEEMLALVLRAKRILDLLFVVLIAASAALLGLVFALASRMRSDEMRTLHEIGCSRSGTRAIQGFEILLVLALGLGLALAGLLLTQTVAPSLSSWL